MWTRIQILFRQGSIQGTKTESFLHFNELSMKHPTPFACLSLISLLSPYSQIGLLLADSPKYSASHFWQLKHSLLILRNVFEILELGLHPQSNLY